MSSTFKHISYEEWLENNPDIAAQEKQCEECNGDGEIECFHCGHMSECGECGGTGKTQDSHELYEAQIDADEKAMQKYLKSIGAN